MAPNLGTLSRSWLLAVLSIVTVSCGGGGGDAASPPSQPAPTPALVLVAGAPPNGTDISLTQGYVDGPALAARFRGVQDLAVDAAGTIYVVDSGNRKVRKISPAGDVSTLASFGDSPSTSLDGIALDPAGNVFVTRNEYCPPSTNCVPQGHIDRIDPAGSVTPVNIASSSDGTGIEFGEVNAIARAPNGDLYFSEHTFLPLKIPSTIRKLTPSGDATRAPFGDGASAMTFDTSGNIYVDTSVSVTKVQPGGAATALSGPFALSLGVAADDVGNAYVSDVRDHIIRKIIAPGNAPVIAGVQGIAGYSVPTLPGLLNGPGRMALHGRDLYFAMGNAVMAIRNVP